MVDKQEDTFLGVVQAFVVAVFGLLWAILRVAALIAAFAFGIGVFVGFVWVVAAIVKWNLIG